MLKERRAVEAKEAGRTSKYTREGTELTDAGSEQRMSHLKAASLLK